MCGFMCVFEGEGEEKQFAHMCVCDISIRAERCLSLSAVLDSAGDENNFYPGKEKSVVSQPSSPYASVWLMDFFHDTDIITGTANAMTLTLAVPVINNHIELPDIFDAPTWF